MEESSYVEGTEPLIVPVLREEKRQMDLRREAFARSWALPDLELPKEDYRTAALFFVGGISLALVGIGIFVDGNGCSPNDTLRHVIGSAMAASGVFTSFLAVMA